MRESFRKAFEYAYKLTKRLAGQLDCALYPRIPESCVRFYSSGRKMKVFTQKFNPLSGQNEWVMQDENYDYYQEVARSAYADMLHDKERNQKYYEGIKKAIASVKKKGLVAKVLDIGTGTGLLSMMAVRSGADTVIACEAFKPVAECALKVIKDNGFEDKIKVIGKQSTELTVGPGCDMPERANILVTEVFDTELIGEGALHTFHHALENLLEIDSIVVPSAATVYAQVVQSELISCFNKLSSISVCDHGSVEPPNEVVHCRGAASVHDIQMAQLPLKDFCFISDPLKIFRFEFSDKSSIVFKDKSQSEYKALKDGTCDAVFMWWELEMDTVGEIILSCAPPWTHPDPNNMPWRDHWMQAVYYLPKETEATSGEIMNLNSYHDEFSLWFDVTKSSTEKLLPIDAPVCTCLMHCTLSRSRLGMLNDRIRNEKHVNILKKYITPSTVCLCVGNGSLLPLLAAKLGAKLVFAIDPSFQHCKVLEAYSSHNSLESSIKIINKSFDQVKPEDLQNELADIILAEPYFTTSLVPWDALYFWYLKAVLKPLLKQDAVTVPHTAKIRAMAVEFEDLWKIRAPVIEAEGFLLSAFDNMVQEAISVSDSPVEPQPLWEYKNKSLSEPFDLLTFDLASPVFTEDTESSGRVAFTSKGHCNGVAIWADFETSGINITTGPTSTVLPGKPVLWDMFTRQGVYFIQPHAVVDSENKELVHKVKFSPKTGQLDFSFSVYSSNK